MLTKGTHLFLKEGDDCMEQSMLEEQDRMSRYHNNPVASVAEQVNLMAGVDQNFETLPETSDDDGN